MRKSRSLFVPYKVLLRQHNPVIKNEAGGLAYQGTPKEAIAQLATTSCLNNTLYCTAEKQLDQIQKFAIQVDQEFIAKTAILSREKYHMKDVPALLTAFLATRYGIKDERNQEIFRKTFSRVIDNGDMLRKFFEIIRSGKLGRRSFGSLPKQMMINWFNSRTPTEVFEQSIGTPSMRDILRLVRPKPLDKTRSALYGWFVGKTYEPTNLPEKVQDFERWKADETDFGKLELPHVPFQMLTNIKLNTEQWTTIAKKAGWKWLLKNINNMIKHGVFDGNDEVIAAIGRNSNMEMIDFVASRLSDRKSIQKACPFPYLILNAYQNAKNMPKAIQKALHDALDIATENVPALPEAKGGNPPVHLFVDVSKSMTYPVTGVRYGLGNRANSSMTRADVASLIACSIMRRNHGSKILLFNTEVVPLEIDIKKPVLENSTIISKMANGGTACSAPLKRLNELEEHGDLVIIVSDDQSWVESLGIDRYGKKSKNEKTALQQQWEIWKNRNPNAKLVCVDIAPYTTTQVQKDKDVLNIGGWSDMIYDLIGQFASGSLNPDHLVGVIESVNLDNFSDIKEDFIED